MVTVFRVLDSDPKDVALCEQVQTLRSGDAPEAVFVRDLDEFHAVPGSPFAYWAPAEYLEAYKKFEPLQSGGRDAKQGLATADDSRFVRCWWEVQPNRILDASDDPTWRTDLDKFREHCNRETLRGKKWVPFAKGGAYSPFYADLHLVVNWENEGKEIKGFDRAYVRNEEHYYKPGLTWPRRTQKGLNFRQYPAGAVFADKGPIVLLPPSDARLMLGMLNSEAIRELVTLQMTFGSFEVGVIQKVPIPSLDEEGTRKLDSAARAAVAARVHVHRLDETNHYFTGPFGLNAVKLSEVVTKFRELTAEAEATVRSAQAEIDEEAWRGYFGGRPTGTVETATSEQQDDEDDEEAEFTRPVQAEAKVASDLLSYLVGMIFGRWDLGKARESRSEVDVFAPLPRVPPGALSESSGGWIRETPEGYPIDLVLSGILVDDADHEDDLIRRLRKAADAASGRGDSVLNEAASMFEIDEVREYFRKPSTGGFWADHIARYSMSRRKAPIYWFLQSSARNYALWLYYQRLDRDLIWKALTHYVEPKIRLESDRLSKLREEKTALGESGAEAKRKQKDIETQEAFVSELEDFETKLRRVAELNLEYDLDDGVPINIAPFWELVPWKEPKKTWDELLEGKYEWSSMSKQLRALGVVEE